MVGCSKLVSISNTQQWTITNYDVMGGRGEGGGSESMLRNFHQPKSNLHKGVPSTVTKTVYVCFSGST